MSLNESVNLEKREQQCCSHLREDEKNTLEIVDPSTSLSLSLSLNSTSGMTMLQVTLSCALSRLLTTWNAFVSHAMGYIDDKEDIPQVHYVVSPSFSFICFPLVSDV